MSTQDDVYLRSTIFQGDALTWLARPNALADGVSIDGNWSCNARIIDIDGAEVVATWEVTGKTTYESNEYFLVTVASSVSATLDAGHYSLIVDIANATVTPEYSRERPVELQVLTQGLAP